MNEIKVNYMKFFQTIFGCLCFAVFFAACESKHDFVKVKGSQFFIGDSSYRYIGTNYWYAGLLGNTAEGKKRLQQELDFLQQQGVINVRVMAAVEGEGLINGVPRVQPPLQITSNVFDSSVLYGLDYLLTELGKRNMKAVLFISNNWEWSGGFLQYLNWNNLLPDAIMRRKLTWDENRDYASKFYSCQPCTDGYEAQLRLLVGRTNSISGKKYTNDEAIMAWELANEPRPMRPNAIEAYKTWISNMATLIKQIDKNHLVTIGTEGYIGTETMEVYQAIHENINIDYLTIHIWPKNWGWFKADSIQQYFDTVLNNTNQYIQKHITIAKAINKPLVIEEFGLPRDAHDFKAGSSVAWRNKYYANIFGIWKQHNDSTGVIAGCNFWAFGGNARPIPNQVYWKKGDDFMGDPPMEEQGLNTVFDSDSSTWQLIRSFTKPTNPSPSKE